MVYVNITRPVFFKGLEWFLFLGLCTLSAYFMREVLDQFISGDTSFKVYEKFIEDIPTMVLCSTERSNFSSLKNEDLLTYHYRRDFNFTYLYSVLNKGEWVEDKITLKEGKNIIPNHVIYLEKLATAWNGFCYKINETASKIEHSEWRHVKINYNKTLAQERLPSWIVHFTSEKNSYGVLRYWWFDGAIVTIKLHKSSIDAIELKPQIYKYLPNYNSSCGESSFYECWGSKLLASNFDKCPRKCIPYSLPNNAYYKIPLCNTKEQWDCAHQIANMVMENITKSGSCPKLCTVSHYSGRTFDELSESDYWNEYSYTIAHPFTVTITEEYLIYDAITVIGSVGGTLGMCIGFSFTNIIAYIIILMQKLIDKFQNKFSKS